MNICLVESMEIHLLFCFSGSPEKLYESVHSQILSLVPEFLLYPGHDYTGKGHSINIVSGWAERLVGYLLTTILFNNNYTKIETKCK